MRRFDSCDEILLESMSALGHLFFEGNESAAYSTARQRSLSLCLAEGSDVDIDAQRVVDFITALILLTHLEFGADNEEQASLCLSRASRMAIRYGFNLLDVTSDDAGQDQSLLVQICQGDVHIIETARRVWWEVRRRGKVCCSPFVTYSVSSFSLPSALPC
jgi:hypothetical protein